MNLVTDIAPPSRTYCLYVDTIMLRCSRITTRIRASGKTCTSRSAISLLS